MLLLQQTHRISLPLLLQILFFAETAYSHHNFSATPDVCGLSLHKSDYPFPFKLSFDSAHVEWSIPHLYPRLPFFGGGEMASAREQHTLIPDEDADEENGTAPLAGIAQELVMCCGDNCLQGRLSAGVWTWWSDERRRAKSELVVWWAPWHEPVRIEMPISAQLTPADIVWIEIIRLSRKKAQVIFKKYINPYTNLTIKLLLDIATGTRQTNITGTMLINNGLRATLFYPSPHQTAAPSPSILAHFPPTSLFNNQATSNTSNEAQQAGDNSSRHSALPHTSSSSPPFPSPMPGEIPGGQICTDSIHWLLTDLTTYFPRSLQHPNSTFPGFTPVSITSHGAGFWLDISDGDVNPDDDNDSDLGEDTSSESVSNPQFPGHEHSDDEENDDHLQESEKKTNKGPIWPPVRLWHIQREIPYRGTVELCRAKAVGREEGYEEDPREEGGFGREWVLEGGHPWVWKKNVPSRVQNFSVVL